MFNKIKRFFKVLIQLSAPITHNRLMLLGFEYYHPFYILTDLTIEVDIRNNHFYYVDVNGNQIRIKIMRDISNLVYGVIDYAK